MIEAKQRYLVMFIIAAEEGYGVMKLGTFFQQHCKLQ